MTTNAPSISRAELAIEGIGLAACVAALPFYMGIIHASALNLILYVGIASAALAAGERIRFVGLTRDLFHEFREDWLACGRLLLAGFVFWLIALIAI